jgi:predicted O-methyltransferase YrrM
MDLALDITTIKGFLADDEARALFAAAQAESPKGPVLEIGSYCGKSTVVLGAACQQSNAVLYAVDHHRGSEEHQQGEFFHDPDLYDPAEEQFDSFREFRKNIARAGLHNTVVPLVSSSDVASRGWNTALSMVFIDGGHSLDAALTDYRCWASHIVRGGILAIHDVFDKPEEGGQAPIAIYRLALASGLFEALERVNSLALLRRY